MYTCTHCFLYFFDFSIFLYEKKKTKTEKKTNKNKAMYKVRLTQNNMAKHTSNANKKTRKGERNSDKIT